MENMYFPVDIHTIRSDAYQSFNLYYQSGNDRMEVYCTEGEQITDTIEKKIEDYHIKTFYILKKDKLYYDLYVEEILAKILDDPALPLAVKVRIAYRTINDIARQLFESPDEELIYRYKETIFDTTKFVLNDVNALHGLFGMMTFDFSTYNHNINVGIIGIGLLQSLLEDCEEHDFGEIAAAFFLHDMGKTEVPNDILLKKSKLSNAELTILRNHPQTGVRILENLGALTEEAEIVVSQHHERYNGSGYPLGLKGENIHTYAKICSIADVFDGLTSFRPFRKEHSYFDALKIMKSELFKYFDPDYFQKFVMLFRK